jgi:hypothetical protein
MTEMAAMSTAACGLANKYGAGAVQRGGALDDYNSPKNQLQEMIAQAGGALRGMPRNRLMLDEAQSPPKSTFMTKRLVRVFLVDPNESVPLDSSMLYKSDEKLTDLTDQELFFEIPVQELLTKHNALRATLLDKAATKRSNKDVMLEPAKIRDLTMTVLVLETW